MELGLAFEKLEMKVTEREVTTGCRLEVAPGLVAVPQLAEELPPSWAPFRRGSHPACQPPSFLALLEIVDGSGRWQRQILPRTVKQPNLLEWQPKCWVVRMLTGWPEPMDSYPFAQSQVGSWGRESGD